MKEGNTDRQKRKKAKTLESKCRHGYEGRYAI